MEAACPAPSAASAVCLQLGQLWTLLLLVAVLAAAVTVKLTGGGSGSGSAGSLAPPSNVVSTPRGGAQGRSPSKEGAATPAAAAAAAPGPPTPAPPTPHLGAHEPAERQVVSTARLLRFDDEEGEEGAAETDAACQQLIEARAALAAEREAVEARERTLRAERAALLAEQQAAAAREQEVWGKLTAAAAELDALQEAHRAALGAVSDVPAPAAVRAAADDDEQAAAWHELEAQRALLDARHATLEEEARRLTQARAAALAERQEADTRLLALAAEARRYRELRLYDLEQELGVRQYRTAPAV